MINVYGVINNIGRPHPACGVLDLILMLVLFLMFIIACAKGDEVYDHFKYVVILYIIMHSVTFLYLFAFFIILCNEKSECSDVLLKFY